jgi:hypothetical protein
VGHQRKQMEVRQQLRTRTTDSKKEKMMVPAKTYDLLGSRMQQLLSEHSADDYYAIEGTVLNELRVLAVRFDYPFSDANEKRDWQNRLNSMVDNAISIGDTI